MGRRKRKVKKKIEKNVGKKFVIMKTDGESKRKWEKVNREEIIEAGIK